MEQLMKKAITEFKKLKVGEIRTVAVHEASHKQNKCTNALFYIEYVSSLEAEYEHIYIAVSNDGSVCISR